MKNVKKILIFMLSLCLTAGSFFSAIAQTGSTFTVTIVKYIDGVHATAANASSSSFPMHAVFPGGEGDFNLSASGFNNPNAYEATTAAMSEGSNYSVSETLADNMVGTTCDGNHLFALAGYSVGDTLAAAASTTSTMTAPSLTNISGNKYIVIWNTTCPPPSENTGALTVTKNTTGGNGIFNFTGNGGISPFQITTTSGTGSQTINGLAPGSYTITEGNLPSGWSTGSTTCTNVNVVAGQTATCQINNTFTATSTANTGSLTVTKNTIGGNGTFKFASDNAGVGNFSITTVAGSGSKTFTNLAPGSYDVEEITPLPLNSGWIETMTTCNDVMVSAGQTATCEIENTLNATSTPSTSTVQVTIVKYIDGAPATAVSADYSTFPMTSTWSAANIGTGSGNYTLGPSGFNNSNPYWATTSPMTSGASYSTTENVPATCGEDDNWYQLAGYSVGNTLAEAANMTPTMTVPNLTNITNNKFIIVWNTTCSESSNTGSLMVTKNTNGGNGTFNFTGNGGISPFQITTANGTGSKTIDGLAPGSYTITEGNLPSGWSLDDSDCKNVNVVAGQTVTCEIENTFSNGGSNGGGGGEANIVKVHILKYLDGVQASATSANNYLFPMTATWSAANIGTGSGNYVLGNSHGGASNQYGADTAPMSRMADYATSEITSNTNSISKVLPPSSNCVTGKYQLVGYTIGDTLAQAQAAAPTTAVPAFSDLTSDKYVIVWNKTCNIGRGTISGIIFNDMNRNGKRDIGEMGLSGWMIYLDNNNNGKMDSGESSATSGMLGAYRFMNLADGTYHIRLVKKTGWSQSVPVGAYDVTINNGNRNIGSRNFGNYSNAMSSSWKIRAGNIGRMN